jgi:hypothetical protein
VDIKKPFKGELILQAHERFGAVLPCISLRVLQADHMDSYLEAIFILASCGLSNAKR